MAMAC